MNIKEIQQFLKVHNVESLAINSKDYKHSIFSQQPLDMELIILITPTLPNNHISMYIKNRWMNPFPMNKFKSILNLIPFW